MPAFKVPFVSSTAMELRQLQLFLQLPSRETAQKLPLQIPISYSPRVRLHLQSYDLPHCWLNTVHFGKNPFCNSFRAAFHSPEHGASGSRCPVPAAIPQLGLAASDRKTGVVLRH